jgi:hypothetical protein
MIHIYIPKSRISPIVNVIKALKVFDYISEVIIKDYLLLLLFAYDRNLQKAIQSSTNIFFENAFSFLTFAFTFLVK